MAKAKAIRKGTRVVVTREGEYRGVRGTVTYSDQWGVRIRDEDGGEMGLDHGDYTAEVR